MSLAATDKATDEAAARRLRPAPRRARLSQTKREWVAAYLFLLPDALGLFVFLGLPMVLALGLGFFDVSGFGTYTFVGWANYQRMLNDPLFLGSLGTTARYVLVLVPGLYVSGLGLALLVKRPWPAIGLFRGMLFLPNVVSLVVVGLIWQFLLVDRIGVVNVLLSRVGLGGRSWLGNPDLALGTLLAVTIWFLMGFYMLIFLAGLQEIPREFYDAARIDGAGPVRAFFSVTLPLLTPTIFFNVVLNTIGSFQVFDRAYVLTGGGPNNATLTMVLYLYHRGFGEYGRFEFGYASALAWALFAIILVFTLALVRSQSRWVHYEGGRPS